MKRIFIILAILLCWSNILFSQTDDLTIAQNLIGKYKNEIDTILKLSNLKYYKTFEDVNSVLFYLERKNQSIRAWTLHFNDLIRKDSNGEEIILAKDICTEVFVRYHHTNLNDLNDFYSIVLPPNDKVIYEKSLGKDVSHLRLTRELK
jgi:hypothetical protein